MKIQGKMFMWLSVFLLAMAMAERPTQIGRVSEVADAEVARVELRARETALQPWGPCGDAVFHFQQVDDGVRIHA